MGGHVAARAHIGKDIRAAESVNRLLRVADKQQRGIRLLPPDAAENAVLLWVGILEFIDHRHRKTLANSGGQRVTAVALQRFIETA